MKVQGTTVTGKVLADTGFCDFNAHIMMLPSPIFKANAMTLAHPSMYATHLSTAKEAFSSHVTTKCVTNSYTFLDKTLPQHMYAENPSSTRATEDQRGIYVRGLTVWRQGVTY